MDARSMKQPANVGSIHIVESLIEKGHASKTGARLRDVLEPLAAEKAPIITVHFHRPHGKNDVLECLKGILSQSLAENRVPMLHLETHGAVPLPGERTSRGLVVESGDWCRGANWFDSHIDQ
jgi:hypothetical protein